MTWRPDSPALRSLLTALIAETSPVYLAGGAVRDLLLKRSRPLSDLDILVPHSAIPIARRIADRIGWAFYILDKERDVARLVFTASTPPLVADIAAIRGGSLESDLRARDFTINALALPLYQRPDGFASDDEIIDVVDGRTDITARRLRRVSQSSLADDPLRLLRAIRFSEDLGFPIEDATRDQILRMPGALTFVSPERIRDELWKILAGKQPAQSIERMRTLALLPRVLPEIARCDLVTQSAPHDKDVYQHTLAVIQAATTLRDWLSLPAATRTPAPHPPTNTPPPAAPPATPPATPPTLQTILHALEPWAYYLRRHFAPAIASGHTRAEWLIWHALLHDIGKPTTRTTETQNDGTPLIRFLGHEQESARMARERLEFLRFSRHEIDLCTTITHNHMRPHHLHNAFPDADISRRARYRFFRDIGGADIERPIGIDVLITALADFIGTRETHTPQETRAYLLHIAQMLSFTYSEHGVTAPALQPLIDGHLLMKELGLPTGPQLGQLIEELAEAQAAGEITTQPEALTMARHLVHDAKKG